MVLKTAKSVALATFLRSKLILLIGTPEPTRQTNSLATLTVALAAAQGTCPEIAQAV